MSEEENIPNIRKPRKEWEDLLEMDREWEERRKKARHRNVYKKGGSRRATS